MSIESSPYFGLVEEGLLTTEVLAEAQRSAAARGITVERILLHELQIPRCSILQVLSRKYACQYLQYDERLPVPTRLFAGLDGRVLRESGWFPVRQLAGRVIIASTDPSSQKMRQQVRERFPHEELEFRVALHEDVHWYIQDYLHAEAPLLIGIERTGLAYWRNTMALWRTKLAAHRTAHARARTAMKLLRWGLAMVAFADVLQKLRENVLAPYHVPILLLGILLALIGLVDYLKARGTHMDLPCEKALIDITIANIAFTERYHLPEAPSPAVDSSPLARLAAAIPPYCSILRPVPASKERTHLARERNMLAAQRTIAASHRSSYARARTGLSLIRTGVAFIGLGIAVHKLLGTSPYRFTEYLLMGAGALMLVDGLIWYLPARRLKYGMGREYQS